MIRQAWVMKLKPGHEAEYKRKHDEIWPEMTANMKRDGVHNYSIYLHGTTLFAYLERDGDAPTPAAGKPGPDAIIWKWWAWMAPHMETNPDTSPVVEPVEEMFFFPG